MILFSVPKPFIGEYDIIQRNAIKSWLQINPKPKIVLMGNEKGIKNIVSEYKLIHIKKINRNQQGTPLLNDIYLKMNKFNDRIFMYINTDIVLLNSPYSTIELLLNRFSQFLAVGRRYEINIKKRISIRQIKRLIHNGTVKQKNDSWIDYFLFTKGIFDQVPPFALGKTFWDKWLVWSTLKKEIPVIDITKQLTAIHQTHTYSINSKTNAKTVWAGEEAYTNLLLAEGWSCSSTIADSSFKLINNILLHQKKKQKPWGRMIMDELPLLWPVFLKIRLLRERCYSIMHKYS